MITHEGFTEALLAIISKLETDQTKTLTNNKQLSKKENDKK